MVETPKSLSLSGHVSVPSGHEMDAVNGNYTSILYNATMIYAIFFCSGIVVGLAAAVPLYAFLHIAAQKVVDVKRKGELARAQMDAIKSKQMLDEKMAKLRAGNPEMSERQEEIARRQLEDVFQVRDRR